MGSQSFTDQPKGDPGTVLSGSCARIWKSQEGTAALTVVTWVALMTCCCKMLRVLSAGARASTRTEHSSCPSGHFCNCILLVSISKQDPRTDGLRTSRHISGSGIASTSGRARSEGHWRSFANLYQNWNCVLPTDFTPARQVLSTITSISSMVPNCQKTIKKLTILTKG